jgi:hypothetical protein
MDMMNNENKNSPEIRGVFIMVRLYAVYLCYITEHKDKMANAAGHNK